ncbi:MAG: coproporphyrinogen III oxidase family protein [Candidatus Omnitrophica bacterium]|nr:coproporphyrinogen III oxidase family protein [Candidatus Omnitrophota bacterium]
MDRRKIIEHADERVRDFRRLIESGLICSDGDFFPSVHYPPITMYPPATEADIFKGYSLPPDGKFDIYAHIPFCINHCAFCHYPVKTGPEEKEKDKYLSALEHEMDLYMRRLGVDKIKPKSILIGGGTPTHLSVSQLERFLKFFTERLDMSTCTQFNYDLDPATLLGSNGALRSELLRKYGVDRLTIGVQSLLPSLLKEMNRPHSAEDAIKSVRQSKEAGFKVNIEFIFGYPGQTIDNWIENVEKAAELGTEEIQLYRLKIIPYGDFPGSIKEKYLRDPGSFPSPETAIMMKDIAHSVLASHGYTENLRRVFSKKRGDFSHYADNQCCKLFDQIGFGLTAFSSLRDRFALNTFSFDEYYSMVGSDRLPANRGLVRTKDDQIRWGIILPLKNREVIKKMFELQTGESLNRIFRKKIDALKEHGLLLETEKKLSLTDLGKFFADEVCQSFHDPKYIPFPRSAFREGPLNPYND